MLGRLHGRYLSGQTADPMGRNRRSDRDGAVVGLYRFSENLGFMGWFGGGLPVAVYEPKRAESCRCAGHVIDECTGGITAVRAHHWSTRGWGEPGVARDAESDE